MGLIKFMARHDDKRSPDERASRELQDLRSEVELLQLEKMGLEIQVADLRRSLAAASTPTRAA